VGCAHRVDRREAVPRVTPIARELADGPGDALSVAAPANPSTRQTECLSPQQMRVCDPPRARQAIRQRGFAPPDFGFTPASWLAAARELVCFWCVKLDCLRVIPTRSLSGPLTLR